MPVFHTKTIEAILEPVAQQVSQLVILHEEAEDGSAMPDLAVPIQAVGSAVKNLVKVGKETTALSNDKILKQEMPLAFTRVEESSVLLVDASQMLKKDPYSSAARQKLIDGARGILSGTSALLLTFDEAEVRKILRLCKSVLEYLAVAEVVECMEDLVTFIKNLTPGITDMAKSVEAREQELTHQVHRNLLKASITNVKALTPLLISSIKAFVSTIQRGGTGRAEAQENRNYVVGKMSAEINEIMRVLQLTTYEEDGTDDPIYDMKKAGSILDSKMDQARDWLGTPTTDAGGLGERAVRDIIAQGRKVADSCPEPERTRMRKVCDDLDRLLGELATLRRNGQGTSPHAQALAGEIANKIQGLQADVANAIERQSATGVKKPVNTYVGKLEQAQLWLNNPAGDHTGLGEKAIRECIADARRVAQHCQGPERAEILRAADEVEQLTNELAGLKARGMGNSPQAQAIARRLEGKLKDLQKLLQKANMQHVASDFMDTTTAVKQLEKAARAPPEMPNREQDFQEKAGAFEFQANKAAETANRMANSGSSANKALLDNIRKRAQEVKDLTPQVSHSAKILLDCPGDAATSSHFDHMKNDWVSKMDDLTDMVDAAVDIPDFIRACEEGIKQDIEGCRMAIAQENPQMFVAKSSNIARKANRVVKIAEKEAENSEDREYIDKITDATEKLRSHISPLVIDARSVATGIKDRGHQGRFMDRAMQLQNAVGDVRKTIATQYEPPEEDEPPLPPPPPEAYAPPPPPPPDMSSLHIAEKAPPRPPPPQEERAPARPPPPRPQVVETVDLRAEAVLQKPPEDNRMAIAAHQLHQEIKKWDEQGNAIIQAAKKMAILFAQMSRYLREEDNQGDLSKKELIGLAKSIAKQSEEVRRLAKAVADECSDKRLRMTMLQTIDRIPTISTQLKIVATVKATMLGAEDEQADQEATETLVGCAENLMLAVRQTVRESEAASVKIKSDIGQNMRWKRADEY